MNRKQEWKTNLHVIFYSPDTVFPLPLRFMIIKRRVYSSGNKFPGFSFRLPLVNVYCIGGFFSEPDLYVILQQNHICIRLIRFPIFISVFFNDDSRLFHY